MPETMTREQALEWCRSQKWHFKSYYKYRFTFTADDGKGTTASVSTGGHSQDIYRFEVNNGIASFEDITSSDWDLRIRGEGPVLYEGDCDS